MKNVLFAVGALVASFSAAQACNIQQDALVNVGTVSFGKVACLMDDGRSVHVSLQMSAGSITNTLFFGSEEPQGGLQECQLYNQPPGQGWNYQADYAPNLANIYDVGNGYAYLFQCLTDDGTWFGVDAGPCDTGSGTCGPAGLF